MKIYETKVDKINDSAPKHTTEDYDHENKIIIFK